MTTLRVLLVDSDETASERMAGRLEQAHHAVLPAGGLEEAAMALEIQRFDAVVVSAKLVSDKLRAFRAKVTSLQNGGKAPLLVPFVCYAATASEEPTAEELERCQVDACLSPDFEGPGFSGFISHLAAGLNASQAAASEKASSGLPIFKDDVFQEQLGFDRELTIEILDLYFTESQSQVVEMRSALERDDLLQLSRTAHSLKGSLGSLYAMEAAWRAQLLEQVAKNGDAANAAAALAALETALTTLEPELRRLRDTEPVS